MGSGHCKLSALDGTGDLHTSGQFDIAEDSHVELKVFDVAGRLVMTLIDGPMARNRHTIRWDGRDEHGQSVGSGIYLYRMTAGGFIATRKMVVIK